MTIVAAYRTSNSVWLGCDAGVFEDSIVTLTADTKAWRIKNTLIGVAGTFRDIDIVRQTRQDDPYALRDALVTERTDAYEATILVANSDGLFYIDTNLAVVRARESYAAIGAANATALGALHVGAIRNTNGRQIVQDALVAASVHTTMARPPFTVLKLSF